LASTLGTGNGALDKINAELKKQGLMESTGVETVSTKRDNTGVIVGMIDCLKAYSWFISPFALNCVLFCIVCHVVMGTFCGQSVPLVHCTTALTSSNHTLSWRFVHLSGVVVGCVGGGALIIAIASYYLYFVKPAPKTRHVEDAPIVAPAAPIVAPAASFSGYTP
jgi:hypothetical protein